MSSSARAHAADAESHTALDWSLNWKCMYFTAVCASAYWWLPPKSLPVLFAMLTVPYIAMAHYDSTYKCDRRLKPTLVPFGRYIFLPFKPADYQEEYSRTMTPEHRRVMDKVDAGTAACCACVLAMYLWARVRD